MREIRDAVFFMLVRSAIALVIFFVVSHFTKGFDGFGGLMMPPTSPNTHGAGEDVNAVLRKLHTKNAKFARPNVTLSNLSAGERTVITNGALVLPPLSPSSPSPQLQLIRHHRRNEDAAFDIIGGMDELKKELRLHIVVPLRHHSLFFASPSLRPPYGVLFHGPPGTGKTTLARCIAREAEVPMIAIRASDVENLYFGESGKCLRSAFSLAAKLQPSIIFIDEIDAIIRKRSDLEHEATYSVKCELLQLLDDVENSKVIVIATTNTASSLDKALYRRLSRTYEMKLPDAASVRRIIENVVMRGEEDEANAKKGIASATNIIDQIITSGGQKSCSSYSGGDLTSLYKFACMHRAENIAAALLLNEKKKKKPNESADLFVMPKAPPLRASDWQYAIEKLSASMKLRL